MSGDLKVWGLAAGALGAGFLVGAQLTKKEKKDNPQDANGHSNGYANGHSNGKANGAIAIPSAICTNENVLKEDLAIGHRLIAAYGMDELTGNHFSARLPGWAADDFWCTPGNILWPDIHEKHLVKKSANVTTNVLHTAVYQACPDALAVCHVHAPAIEAVSCLKEGLQIWAQGGGLFPDRVAYHDWQGISDCDDEAEDIIKSFKTSAKAPQALMMRNHGAITVGKSVAEAFIAMYFLNRACATQLAVMSSGGKINYPLKEVLDDCANDFETKWIPRWPVVNWPGIKEWAKSAERGDIPPLIRSNLS